MPLFGMITFATEYSMQPGEVGRAIEERGLDAFYLSEHTHIPTSKKSKYPGGYRLSQGLLRVRSDRGADGGGGRNQANQARHFYCPYRAARSDRHRQAIRHARSSVGWPGGRGMQRRLEEMGDHGVPFQRRWPGVREHIAAMKELWKNEIAEFHGVFFNFEPSWMYPKPLQAGGPPVLIGSRSDKVFARIVRYADGWCPLLRPGYDLARWVKMLREAAAQAGRRYDDLHLKVSMIAPTPDSVKQALDLGFQEVETFVPSAVPEKALPVIDNFAEPAARFR